MTFAHSSLSSGVSHTIPYATLAMAVLLSIWSVLVSPAIAAVAIFFICSCPGRKRSADSARQILAAVSTVMSDSDMPFADDTTASNTAVRSRVSK